MSTTVRPAIAPPRPYWVYLGLGLLWIAASLAFARWGFNPTDDGLILAQAARILHGAAPHVDITSPRPLGSPLIHTIDIILGTPLLLTSRVIVLLEFVATATITVRLLIGRPLRTWGYAEFGLTVIAFLVNLHRFPLMSWHTIDGVLVTASALLLLEIAFLRRNVLYVALGALLAGCAPLIRQSFALVPLLAILWCLWLYRQQRTKPNPNPNLPRGRAITLAMGLMDVPALLYGAWVLLTSSYSAALDQLLGASRLNDSALQAAQEGTPLYDTDGGMSQEVFNALGGSTVTCGSFVGKCSPPPTASSP